MARGSIHRFMSSVRLHALGRLLAELSPFRWIIALVFFLGLVISAIQPLSVKLSQRIIDELQRGGSAAFLRSVPLALVGLFAVSGLAKSLYMTHRRYVSERVIIRLRNLLFRKYLFL